MLVSAFTSTQIAALVGTAIVTTMPAIQFSGMVQPVSSLTGAAAVMGYSFPMTYFLRVAIGVFTKGLNVADLGGSLLALAAFIPVLTVLSLIFLRKQER
jgi:ribosome-dependent ATPase